MKSTTRITLVSVDQIHFMGGESQYNSNVSKGTQVIYPGYLYTMANNGSKDSFFFCILKQSEDISLNLINIEGLLEVEEQEENTDF